MTNLLRIAFLGCGFITAVHSRHLRRCRDTIVPSYASRNIQKAQLFTQRYGGSASYSSYTAAINDSHVDAVVIAVPPSLHHELTLQALNAGKHVLVEKPAFLKTDDYNTIQSARDRTQRVVLVGENDHYKPLAVCLRRLMRKGVIGEMIFAEFRTLAKRLKRAEDWRMVSRRHS